VSLAAEALTRQGRAFRLGGSIHVPDAQARRRSDMNRRFRALAFAAAGGLLLVAPATTAFAMSPIRFVASPYEINVWADSFHQAKADQMTLVDALEDVRGPETLPAFDTWPNVTLTRYAGKQVPI